MNQLPRFRGLITASVMLATTLYALDWTIVVIAFPEMKGFFAATEDQIAWVVTCYVVASAIAMVTAGWASRRFGRKAVMLFAVGGFTSASFFCGIADSLVAEVVARTVQGFCGGFVVPLSAPIILDNYPPKEHSKALSVWSIGVFGGSFVGPVIGGYLVDYLSWRWVFYINIPFGIIAFLGLLFFMQESKKDKNSRLDWFGFLSLAIGVSALQVMADRGHRLDWFDSPEIVLEGLIACLALYLFAMHTITSRRPLLDPKLLYIRQFRIAVLLLAFYGILQTPVIVVMPVFLEDLIGYPVKSVGLLQLPRGIGLLIGLIVAGRLSGRVDPRFLLAFGFVSVAVSNFAMAQWSLEVSQASIIWTGTFQGIGGAFIMLPTQEIAFYGSHPTQRTDASAIMNLIRSMCSSLGVSITLILYFINSGISRNDLIPNINLYSDSFNITDTNIRSTQALAQMNQEIDRQASMLGYDGAFLFLAILAFIPIVMLLFTKKLLVGDQKSN